MKIHALGMLIITYLISTSIRFENFLLFPIFIFGYFIFSKRFRKLFDMFVIPMLLVLFVCMFFFESVVFKMFRMIPLTVDFFYLNLFDFFNAFNLIFLVLAFSSFILYKRKDLKGLKFIFISFLVFSFFYLPLFKINESRMILVPLIFIIVLASYSLNSLSNSFNKNSSGLIFIVLFLVFFGFSLNNVYHDRYHDQNILKTRIVGNIVEEIPKNSFIISEFPSVVTSISDVKGIKTETVLNNPEIIDNILENNELFYFYDGYCQKPNRKVSPSEGSELRCEEILKKLKHKKVKEFDRGDVYYFLYKIEGLAEHNL